MAREKSEHTAFERAMRYLGRRGYSAVELERKLIAVGVSIKDARLAVSECKRLGLINDELYAADCAAVFAGRGCGNSKIKQELRRRGVGEHVDAAISELEDNELERAIEAAKYKRRLISREEDRRKIREKIWRFLFTRGFSADVIRNAADFVLRGDEQ